MNTLQFSGQKRNNNYKKITQNAYLFHMLYRFLARYELVSKLARLKKNNWLFANIRATFEEEKNYLRIDVSMRHEKLGSCLMYIHEHYTPWC